MARIRVPRNKLVEQVAVDQVFFKLTVIAVAEPDASRGVKDKAWLCRCECGTEIVVAERKLNFSNKRSRGCAQEKHGGTSRPEYKVLKHAIERCGNQNDCGYKVYGGRGIRVCRRWRDSFAAFLEDMGERPTPKHQIDRKDNDGHYSCGKCDECIEKTWPANCHWATKAQQVRNTSRNVNVEWKGETLCLQDWSVRLNIPYATLHARIVRLKWEVERAMMTPVQSQIDCGSITWRGETLSLKAWAKRIGFSYSVLHARIFLHDWTVDRAMTTAVRKVGK